MTGFNLTSFSEICYQWNANAPQLLYFSHIPTAIVAMFLGVFVYFNNKDSLAGKILLIISLAFSLWSLSDLFLFLTLDPRLVMFFWSIISLAELFIFAGSLYFSYAFLEKRDAPLKYKIIVLLLLLPVVFLLPTRTNIDYIDMSYCGGIQGQMVYYVYFVEILLTLWTAIYLIKKIISSKGTEKKIAIYFSIGTSLFLFSFSGTSLISNITAKWPISQYGMLTMPVFMGFLAYLIIRYKAFDIKILGSQVLVISIIALIGSQFFFVENITNVVLIMATLISSAVFGLWLVGSVKKEVKSKETLEKNVLDRTKELEQSKKISEERAAELEKWYKLTIGRELKMAELKKQVEELEDKK
jgi:hypothetical protein